MAQASTAADRRPGLDETFDEIVKHHLRGKCIELSLFLYHGTLPPLLLEEVAELTCDVWALRIGDDA